MLEVFLTVDVEVCGDGWSNIDAGFPEAFRKCVYGPTRHGNLGLPYQIDVLRSHGLTGVFAWSRFFPLALAGQIPLIGTGAELLAQAGAAPVIAFRAGGLAFNQGPYPPCPAMHRRADLSSSPGMTVRYSCPSPIKYLGAGRFI